MPKLDSKPVLIGIGVLIGLFLVPPLLAKVRGMRGGTAAKA